VDTNSRPHRSGSTGKKYQTSRFLLEASARLDLGGTVIVVHRARPETEITLGG
jgi:hypothetical protein